MSEESKAVAGGTPAIESIEQLVAAREAKGLSRADVQQRLKLAPRQMDALERGDWAALPGTAFVRGALRSYARLIHVDVEPLARSVGGSSDMRPISSLDTPLPRPGGFDFDSSSSRASRWPWIAVGAVVVVALALFFGRQTELGDVESWIGGAGSVETGDTRVEPAPPPIAGSGVPAARADLPSAAAPAAGATAPAAAAGPAAPAAAPSAPAAPAPVAAAAPEPPVAAPAPPPPPPPPPAIRLRTAEDSYVEIRQGDGKLVHTGTIKGGSQLDFKGKPPFRFVIGNAKSVRLEYEGTPVELRPFTRDNNVARFTLPQP